MAGVEPLAAGDPAVLGGFVLEGRLGEGGQGVVYLGRDAAGEPVAVKLLHTRLAQNSMARARFLREARAARRVAQFCTAKVIAVEVMGDHPYIVSEFIAGPSLQEQVRREGPVTGERFDRLAIGMLKALLAIHAAGIVHRDFKPGNVLLAPDGPRVIDFGIARAMDAGTLTGGGIVGSPPYMAPEQYAGERLGPAVDLFAWAGTMVYAATGRPAFGTDSLPAIMQRVTTGEPDLGTKEQLPEPIRRYVKAALAKEPAKRPTAEAILEALANPDMATPLGRRGIRRLRHLPRAGKLGLAAGSVALAGALGVVTTASVLGDSRDSPARSPAPATKVTQASVAPLNGPLRTPRLMVAAPSPLPAESVRRIRLLDGVDGVELIEAARTTLRGRSIGIIGVDPSTFRAYTPRPTAEADALWRNLAAGDVAVGHSLGTNEGLGLGIQVPVGTGARQARLRVGAYAQLAIKGVDAVVSHTTAGVLGIPSGNALLISCTRAEAEALRTKIRDLLPGNAKIADT